jgi:hypothetical protein
MRTSRALASVILATALAGATLAASTTASATGSTNSGGRSTGATHYVHHKSVSPAASRTFFNMPNELYVGHTCNFDLSAIPDFTIVSSLDACGITATFDPPVEKRSVPNSWASWGTPPDTETDVPNILFSGDATQVTVTFSSPVRIAGAEAEPDPFEVHPITADFYRPGGGLKATVTRDIDGTGGARLLAVKTKAIGSMVLSSDVDFAFAQLRINLG